MATNQDRLNGLRTYLKGCIAQNIVSLDDLRQPLVILAKLGRTLLGDIKVVGGEMLQDVGAAASMKAAESFFSLAESMGRRK